jgi:hypothetical protein
MLDFKTQSQLVDATASIMRAYVRAATDTAAASASRNLSLWSQMLEAATPRQAPAERPEAPSPALPSWPWLPGAAPAMSWAPLAQAWWLGPSVKFWAPVADWGGWGSGPFPAWSGWNGAAQVPPSPAAANGSARPAPDAGFASYRSSGGHAAAQVIVPAIVPAMELASLTATTALSPMQTMLGGWRAALGA